MDANKILKTKEEIKKIILNKFQNSKFTCGDIIYSLTNNYTASIHGTVRNLLVTLTKEGFLQYTIEIRGTPTYNSKKLQTKGAVYQLKKK
jgi:hypothetical protein